MFSVYFSCHAGLGDDHQQSYRKCSASSRKWWHYYFWRLSWEWRETPLRRIWDVCLDDRCLSALREAFLQKVKEQFAYLELKHCRVFLWHLQRFWRTERAQEILKHHPPVNLVLETCVSRSWWREASGVQEICSLHVINSLFSGGQDASWDTVLLDLVSVSSCDSRQTDDDQIWISLHYYN